MSALRRVALTLAALLALAGAGATWHVQRKLPQREGELSLPGLQAPVEVRWDEAGVPHLRAANELDLYRALGYLHAQDRLFQMEMLRRLSRGELAEILGPDLLKTDRLFRALRIRDRADEMAREQFADPARLGPAQRVLQAYLDGVNAYQDSRPAPLEFELLGIAKRPFTPADTFSVAGYQAFSFATAFRSEPALTRVRQLGPDYLRIFQPEDTAAPGHAAPALAVPASAAALPEDRLQALAGLGRLTEGLPGVPQFEGSNAWAIAGSRSRSGKPLLAGDPHIAFSTPAVWWEAHLQAPGFELYGHHLALNPMALLGHNARAGWSLTMFQNDDVDLVAERVNPANPEQVWHQGRWVTLQRQTARIKVKGRPDETLVLRRSPHGPLINDAIPGDDGQTPIAMWWAMLETENPVLDGFHALGRAATLAEARAAVEKIHAPGLNIVWAGAQGDIAWWAAAKLPRRAAGADPRFILDGAGGEAEKTGFLPFSANPQEENPTRGYIVSANHQPAGAPPGYYNLGDRGRRLDQLLSTPGKRWDLAAMQALQLDVQTAYGPRLIGPLLPLLRRLAPAADQPLVQLLAQWQGDYPLDSRAAPLAQQLAYELMRAAMRDELGEAQFENLRRVRAIDHALPRLMADADSPWWDDRGTPERETRDQIVAKAWAATLARLQQVAGADRGAWTWGRLHQLTHEHALGRKAPLDRVFNVGPFAVPGSHEMPNNMAARLDDAPWRVAYGPSTRRVIDFADVATALGSNPVGQSGVWPDRHYADQALDHAQGRYRRQWFAESDVAAHARSTMRLLP